MILSVKLEMQLVSRSWRTGIGGCCSNLSFANTADMRDSLIFEGW